MNHKKSNSMIHVPFSWEEIPGVPKFVASPSVAPGLTGNHHESPMKTVLPLPPGSFSQPVRSGSKRVFLWEEDPFLAALLECTKDSDSYKCKGEIRKNFGTRVRVSKYFLFSCKHSFDVEESSLLSTPSNLGSTDLGERGRSGVDRRL